MDQVASHGELFLSGEDLKVRAVTTSDNKDRIEGLMHGPQPGATLGCQLCIPGDRARRWPLAHTGYMLCAHAAWHMWSTQ